MEFSTFAFNVASEGSGVSNVHPANWRADDGPGPSHYGVTLVVSDDESVYSGITNEDYEDLEDDEEVACYPIKEEEEEEETLPLPKEEEFSDEEPLLAEEVPADQLLIVKEERFSDASDIDFVGFDESIAISGPAKWKEGLSPDEEGEGDGNEYAYQLSTVKTEEFDMDVVADPPYPTATTVSRLRCVPIIPRAPHIPKGNRPLNKKIFNCYYCPASFKMKAYLPRHVRQHLQNGDPKYEVGDVTGKKAHPAYMQGTVWPCPPGKRKQVWDSKPWRGRRFSDVYHCYYCATIFKFKSSLRIHVLDHLKKGDLKFEVTDSNGRKVHPAYLFENDKHGLWAHKKQSSVSDRPLKCHLCNFTGKHQSVLRTHLKLKAKQALEPKMFSCSSCDWTTRRKDYLSRHMHKHIPGKYKCELCTYRSHRIADLEIHMRSHTGEKPYACDLCDERFTGKCHVQRHILKHETRTHRCPHCVFSSVIGTALSEHILNVHLGPRNYGCPLCKFEAGDIVALRSHVKSIHRTKLVKIKCRYCDFEADRAVTLNNHERIHIFPGGGYPCDQCAFISRSEWLLKQHSMRHTGEKPFACNLCDFRCTSRKGITRHKVTHTDNKPVKCSHCDAAFKTQQSAMYHEKYVHNLVEKPFRCHYCDYKTFVKGRLLEHETIHTGERKFPCPECEYTAKLKPTLHVHLRRSHGRGPHNDDATHKCDFCNFRAVSSVGVTSHMKVSHPSALPYSCEYCGAAFKVKPELIDHERVHTGEKKRIRRSGLVYKRWKCRFCDFETIPFKKIKMHYEEFHPDDVKDIMPELIMRETASGKPKIKTKRKCRFCNFESTLRRTVRLHEQKHVYEMMGRVDDKVMKM